MTERRPSELVILDLPAPISTNAIWRNVVINGKPRTLKSGEYRAWQQEAGLKLNTQRPGKVEGPYAMTLQVTYDWRGDLDNAAKCAGDLLQKHNVIANDKHAQRILIERADVPGMRVMIASTKG